jgi:2-(1,2-epoxy-1,2-dihydrophenyl)acetyl-CoA isomerase
VLGLIKANLEDAGALGFSGYLERESDRFIENLGAPDSREAVIAYLEKRPPRYD